MALVTCSWCGEGRTSMAHQRVLYDAPGPHAPSETFVYCSVQCASRHNHLFDVLTRWCGCCNKYILDRNGTFCERHRGDGYRECLHCYEQNVLRHGLLDMGRFPSQICAHDETRVTEDMLRDHGYTTYDAAVDGTVARLKTFELLGGHQLLWEACAVVRHRTMQYWIWKRPRALCAPRSLRFYA